MGRGRWPAGPTWPLFLNAKKDILGDSPPPSIFYSGIEWEHQLNSYELMEELTNIVNIFLSRSNNSCNLNSCNLPEQRQKYLREVTPIALYSTGHKNKSRLSGTTSRLSQMQELSLCVLLRQWYLISSLLQSPLSVTKNTVSIDHKQNIKYSVIQFGMQFAQDVYGFNKCVSQWTH